MGKLASDLTKGEPWAVGGTKALIDEVTVDAEGTVTLAFGGAHAPVELAAATPLVWDELGRWRPRMEDDPLVAHKPKPETDSPA